MQAVPLEFGTPHVGTRRKSIGSNDDGSPVFTHNLEDTPTALRRQAFGSPRSPEPLSGSGLACRVGPARLASVGLFAVFAALALWNVRTYYTSPPVQHRQLFAAEAASADYTSKPQHAAEVPVTQSAPPSDGISRLELTDAVAAAVAPLQAKVAQLTAQLEAEAEFAAQLRRNSDRSTEKGGRFTGWGTLLRQQKASDSLSTQVATLRAQLAEQKATVAALRASRPADTSPAASPASPASPREPTTALTEMARLDLEHDAVASPATARPPDEKAGKAASPRPLGKLSAGLQAALAKGKAAGSASPPAVAVAPKQAPPAAKTTIAPAAAAKTATKTVVAPAAAAKTAVAPAAAAAAKSAAPLETAAAPAAPAARDAPVPAKEPALVSVVFSFPNSSELGRSVDLYWLSTNETEARPALAPHAPHASRHLRAGRP